MRTLILGGPGSGKTERLLGVMESALERGIPPKRVAFCAFTNAASNEGRTRAMVKFRFSSDDLPYYRTLHSLCFRELGIQRHQILQKKHLTEISELTGELASQVELEPDSPAQGVGADPLLTVDHFARTTLQTLEEGWQAHGRGLDWFRLKRFVNAYQLYKSDAGLIDFTDLLTEFVHTGHPVPVDVAIIDEGQDLTPLQWAVIERAFGHCQELWVAGDDDQSCYRWAGAAEDHLLSLDWPRETLPLSHRLPKAIFDKSQEIVKRIGRRYEKEQRPADKPGMVDWVRRADEVDLSQGTWLLLARTRYQLKEMVDSARVKGIVYSVCGVSSVNPTHVRAIQAYEALRAGKAIEGSDLIAVYKAMGQRLPAIKEDQLYGPGDVKIPLTEIWHDALTGITLNNREYYLTCLRRGEKLTAPPRIRIQTIHGAKGMEAESVLLCTDLTHRTYEGFMRDPDSEHRVMYVGATRASQNLFLMTPQTQYGYRMHL